MKLDHQRLHVTVGGFSSEVRREGTAELQDAVPGVSGPQRESSEYQVRGSCGGDEWAGCDAWWMHHPSHRDGDGVDGHVDEGVDCVENVPFRGRVGECEVETERAGCPNWAERDVEDGLVPPLAARKSWNAGFSRQPPRPWLEYSWPGH